MSGSRRTFLAASSTLTDVANRASVSRQTVSNAINSPELLRPDTLRRVREAIADLGYQPNRAARSLRTRSSQLIGMRFPPAQEQSANATIDRFVHSLVGATTEAGYHVLLFAADDDDPVAGYDALLRATAVDAFVVTDTYLGPPQTDALADHDATFVAFGRPWDHPTATHPWVDVDGAAGTALATEHLVARGHQRIVWLGWTAGSRLGEDRRSGWQRVMNAHGFDTAGVAVRAEDSVDAGRQAAARMLDRPAEQAPTAFVCVSDTLAMGVLHELWWRQLAPGTDVAVVGFDDSQVAQLAPPGLTSVRQPLEQAAVEVVRTLGGLLGTPPIRSSGVLLEPTLVVRGTS